VHHYIYKYLLHKAPFALKLIVHQRCFFSGFKVLLYSVYARINLHQCLGSVVSTRIRMCQMVLFQSLKIEVGKRTCNALPVKAFYKVPTQVWNSTVYILVPLQNVFLDVNTPDTLCILIVWLLPSHPMSHRQGAVNWLAIPVCLGWSKSQTPWSEHPEHFTMVTVSVLEADPFTSTAQNLQHHHNITSKCM
jgi:hypothetical protein